LAYCPLSSGSGSATAATSGATSDRARLGDSPCPHSAAVSVGTTEVAYDVPRSVFNLTGVRPAVWHCHQKSLPLDIAIGAQVRRVPHRCYSASRPVGLSNEIQPFVALNLERLAAAARRRNNGESRLGFFSPNRRAARARAAGYIDDVAGLRCAASPAARLGATEKAESITEVPSPAVFEQIPMERPRRLLRLRAGLPAMLAQRSGTSSMSSRPLAHICGRPLEATKTAIMRLHHWFSSSPTSCCGPQASQLIAYDRLDFIDTSRRLLKQRWCGPSDLTPSR